jgi:hypothetical protein
MLLNAARDHAKMHRFHDDKDAGCPRRSDKLVSKLMSETLLQTWNSND